jgi:hypothetical protein
VSVATTHPPVIGQPGSDPGPSDGSDRGTDEDLQAGTRRVRTAAGGWRSLALAGVLYAALSLAVWWNVWSGHPTSTSTCGCGDASLSIWFIEWPAYALAHGLDPLYSAALFHPVGINLLSNTSAVAVGLILAPVTWLFGPVASLNLGLALAPVLSALFTFVLIRRWVSWMPAAFVGGLFYGFSPFIIVNLTNAYLMTAMAAIPPLIVLCLDDLFFRQRRRPVAIGLFLGLLVALQFFIGTEVLIIMAISAVLGIAVLVVAGVGSGRFSPPRMRRVTIGLASGSITAAALLIYPTWFALAGPAHLSGPVWPGRKLGNYGVVLKDLVIPTRNTSAYVRLAERVGGYQGPWLSPDYLGIGAILVVVCGLILWRRDRRLWFFAAVTVVSFILALGTRQDLDRPWQWVAGLPLLHNVIPDRFLLVTFLCVSVMIALIVDHAYNAAAARTRTGATRSGWIGALVGVAVATVALGPTAVYLSAIVPMTTQPIVLPAWFRTAVPELRPRPVLLVFPVPYSGIQSAMTWQAVSGMRFDMVGGGGPEGVVSRDGVERVGETLFGDATYSQLYSDAMYKPDSLTAMRRALQQWGATAVVLPDQPGMPIYDRVTSVPFVAALMTAVTGQGPRYDASSWIWTVTSHDLHSNLTVAALARCASDFAILQSETVDRVVSCVRAPATSLR